MEYAFIDSDYTVIHWLYIQPEEMCIEGVFDILYITVDKFLKYCINIQNDGMVCYVYECDENMSFQDYCYYRKYDCDIIVEYGYSIKGVNKPLKLFAKNNMIEYGIEEKDGKIIPNTREEVFHGLYVNDPKNHFPRRKPLVIETPLIITNYVGSEMIRTDMESEERKIDENESMGTLGNTIESLHTEKESISVTINSENNTPGEVIVKKGDKLDTIDKNTVTLMFVNYYKDDRFSSFVISGLYYHQLKELVIGKCCQNNMDYELLDISDCEHLEDIKIGDCSFSSFKKYTLKSIFYLKYSIDLPVLKSIIVDGGLMGLRTYLNGPGDSFLEMICMNFVDCSFQLFLL